MYTSIDQPSLLKIWFFFLSVISGANLAYSLVEVKWWRIVFLTTGILSLISGIFGGTLGMGYVLYAPELILQILGAFFTFISPSEH